MADLALQPPPAAASAPAPAARQLVAAAELARLGRRSDGRGARRLAAHGGVLCATGILVWLAQPVWFLLLPAMWLHGVAIVTLFAPMHECVHRTAFASRGVNLAVAWVTGVLSFFNSSFYWHFHSWHHRYTQDPARDPELMFPKAPGPLGYALEITGAKFWLRRLLDYPRIALGRIETPFLPAGVRRRVAWSMSAQLLVYLAAAGTLALSSAVLWYWFVPAVLAQPFLRALLICEHTGCSLNSNGLSNTRTTLASFPVRLLMWNMPYHAEHHLYPTVPFHALPELHLKLRGRLLHVAPGYPAANRAVLRSL